MTDLRTLERVDSSLTSSLAQELYNAIDNRDEIGGLAKIRAIIDCHPVGDLDFQRPLDFDPDRNLLNFAIHKGRLEALQVMIDFLIKHNIPFRDSDEEMGPENMVQLAISRVFPQNQMGLPILKAILQHVDPKLCFVGSGLPKMSALHRAAAARKNLPVVFQELRIRAPTELIQELLKNDEGNAESPFIYAADQGSFEVMDEMLSIAPTLIRVSDSKGENALHKAARKNRLKIAAFLLQKDPHLIRECNEKKISAYGIVAVVDKNRTGGSSEMAILLRESILRLPSDEVEMKEKRSLLFGEARGKNIFLDLSKFEVFGKDPSLDFSQYIASIGKPPKTPAQTSLAVVESPFESFLEFVQLPDLQCNTTSQCLCAVDSLRNVRETTTVFDYLRRNGVTHVLRVNVQDCLIHPHSSTDIVKSVQNLHVQEFDWRKRDLTINVLQEAVPDVESLTLYTSGSEALLEHWASKGGLIRLSKLTKVKIIVILGELLPNDSFSKYKERVIAKLSAIGFEFQELLAAQEPLTSQKALAAQEPMAAQEPLTSQKRFQVIQYIPPNGPGAGDGNSGGTLQPVTIFDKMSFMSAFWKILKNDTDKEAWKYIISRGARIAVLDSGVDSLAFENIEGASFTEDRLFESNLSNTHWNIISDPHGTQIAHLIRKMDPCSFLCVAQVYQVRSQGPNLTAATEALDWAIKDRNVDIISISWSYRPPDDNDNGPEMREFISKIGEATSNSKLVFCSIDDEHPRHSDSFPANCPGVIKIATTSIVGIDPEYVKGNNANFSLPGEDLETDVPAYLDPKGKRKIKGSSSATALASGLASLILTFTRLALKRSKDGYSDEAIEEKIMKLKNQGVMRRIFQKMCVEKTTVVQPWEKIFPRDVPSMKICEVLGEFLITMNEFLK
ncbi:hypothetical protein BKA61DRAFT_742753 [Leptodontidium sp. MPI-SDFR-AT-0119]|nr:hypothetical protein BKA61DRAFT_742753 [Leptodontidium sp. MPI-SDFR-AT-0119]